MSLTGSAAAKQVLRGKISGLEIYNGEDGATFIPSVDSKGNLSWSNDKGLDNPKTVNIKGADGERGEKGEAGAQGPQGEQGVPGEKGITFIPSMDEDGNLSWSNDGEMDNPDPVKIVGKDGYSPVKGEDYYTEEDKEEMVEAVLDAVPRASAITVDREGNTTTMTVTMGNGAKSTLVIEYGAGGDPEKITVDGEEIGIEFVYHTLYLYNKGNACDSAHGGWVASTRMHSTNAKAPTLTLGTEAMTAAITDSVKNYESGIVETANGVDLTSFTKLTFVVTGYALSNANGDAAIRVGISDDLADTLEFDASATVTGKGTYEIDVTAFSGVHDIVIYLKTDVGTGNKASVTVSEIYLE